jgi:hypothetical protein
VNQKTPFPDQGRPSVSGFEHDALRSFLNFEVAAGAQTEPIPYWLGQDDPTRFIDL